MQEEKVMEMTLKGYPQPAISELLGITIHQVSNIQSKMILKKKFETKMLNFKQFPLYRMKQTEERLFELLDKVNKTFEEIDEQKELEFIYTRYSCL